MQWTEVNKKCYKLQLHDIEVVLQLHDIEVVLQYRSECIHSCWTVEILRNGYSVNTQVLDEYISLSKIPYKEGLKILFGSLESTKRSIDEKIRELYLEILNDKQIGS